MDASDAFSKKVLVEVNLPQSWTWKQNGTRVVAAALVLEVVNNWKRIFKKS